MCTVYVFIKLSFVTGSEPTITTGLRQIKILFGSLADILYVTAAQIMLIKIRPVNNFSYFDFEIADVTFCRIPITHLTTLSISLLFIKVRVVTRELFTIPFSIIVRNLRPVAVKYAIYTIEKFGNSTFKYYISPLTNMQGEPGVDYDEPNLDPLVCDLCKQEFDSLDTLGEHQKKYHNM